MIESPEYLIARIIELQTDVAHAQSDLNIMMYALIACAIVCIVSFVAGLVFDSDGLLSLFLITLAVGAFLTLLYVVGVYEIGFEYAKLDDLITTYELAYGPLPI